MQESARSRALSIRYECECAAELTGADRNGRRLRAGDIVRYTKSSKTHGFEAGEYARVARVTAANTVTVERKTASK